MKEDNSTEISLGNLIPEEHIPEHIPLIGRELMIFYEIFKGKLIEYKDRKEILNLQRKSFKLLLGSLIVTIAVNRGLTLTKIRSYDFMNLNFGYRFIIRSLTSAVCMYSLFYIPVLKHLFECREALNKKYYPRYKEFLKTQNFLVLNPGILEDPELTQEEYGHYLQLLENIKISNSVPKRKV